MVWRLQQGRSQSANRLQLSQAAAGDVQRDFSRRPFRQLDTFWNVSGNSTKPEQNLRQKVVALGEGVMTGKNGRRNNPFARELHELSFVSPQQIGKELQNKLNKIIAEPFPAEIQALLGKLEQGDRSPIVNGRGGRSRYQRQFVMTE